MKHTIAVHITLPIEFERRIKALKDKDRTTTYAKIFIKGLESLEFETDHPLSPQR